MKSIDLMIGDWVYVAHRGSASHFGKVSALLPSGAVETEIEGAVGLSSSVDPIPLTPEILEKNGWFYPKQSSWMKLDNQHRELWGCIHTDGTLWLYSSGDCDKDESFAEIKYVHELQHCLNLVGIDKDIVL